MANDPPLKQGRILITLDEVPNTRKPVEDSEEFSSQVKVSAYYQGFSEDDAEANADALYLLDRVIYQALMSEKDTPMKRWEGKV